MEEREQSVERVKTKSEEVEMKNESCPECGTQIRFMEGCFLCPICGVRMPPEDAVYTVNDHKARCPCCSTQLRTMSVVATNRTAVYVICLD